MQNSKDEIFVYLSYQTPIAEDGHWRRKNGCPCTLWSAWWWGLEHLAFSNRFRGPAWKPPHLVKHSVWRIFSFIIYTVCYGYRRGTELKMSSFPFLPLSLTLSPFLSLSHIVSLPLSHFVSLPLFLTFSLSLFPLWPTRDRAERMRNRWL